MSAPERYSYSLMQRAENCLLSARFSRETNIGGPAAMLGRLFHDGAAAWLEAHFAGRSEHEAAQTAIGESADPYPLGTYQEALSLLDTWERGLKLAERPLLTLVEQPYEHTIEGLRLSARIDLIQLYESDGKLVCQIDDHKTGRLLPSIEEFTRKMQVHLYAWHVAQEIEGIERFDVGEVYARYGVRRYAEFEPSAFEGVERYLLAAATRLKLAWERDEFPPTPGAHCAQCDAPQRCPIIEQAPILSSKQEAERLLGEVAKSEARTKALKEILKGWVGEHGEVHYGGMLARFALSTRESVDKSKLAAELDLEPFVKRSEYTRFDVIKEPRT